MNSRSRISGGLQQRQAGPSRRGFLAGAAGALATGLTACGTGSGRTGQHAPAAGLGFPVEIPNRYGTARIERAPGRIVTLGTTDHDVTPPLGVVPADLYKWGPWPSGVGPWASRCSAVGSRNCSAPPTAPSPSSRCNPTSSPPCRAP